MDGCTNLKKEEKKKNQWEGEGILQTDNDERKWTRLKCLDEQGAMPNRESSPSRNDVSTELFLELNKLTESLS